MVSHQNLQRNDSCFIAFYSQRQPSHSPHVPRCKRSIWTPFFTSFTHLFWSRSCLQRIRLANTLHKPQIIYRQNIGSAQRKNQRHLRCPATNSFYLHQLGDHRFLTNLPLPPPLTFTPLNPP